VHINLIRLLWLAVSIPGGFVIAGPIGVVAAVGLIEVPAMIFNWVLLRKVGVLNLREEMLNIGVIASAALIAFLGSSVVLGLIPRL
jgi:hypothetical protein